MLFNSYAFIFLYLPLVLTGFFWLARISPMYSATWLALASLFFYGYWNPVFVALLLFSIVFNYRFGLSISAANHSVRKKKHILILGIGANLALLIYYKYANFFVDNLNQLAGSHFNLAEIILPLGISFFTFTQIAFLVDTYQNKVKEYNFIHYTLFVTYFPHLLAGPVLHHREMMPQFQRQENYQLNWDNLANGMLLFILGLCKKTLLADSFALYANAVFKSVEQGVLPTTYEAWAGALAYTMQIYFDFSGYTDMALGVALMCNIKLPINFDSPYQATSIIDFWRRWHMTLSRYLREYLYIPLGGNRQGKMRRYVNLMLTMLLGGLWHGAGWTFIVWGALHGAYLTLNHLWIEQVSEKMTWSMPAKLGTLSAGLFTFLAVVVAWVVFRAHDMASALMMLKAMFGIDARPISFFEVTHGQLLLSSDMSGSFLAKLLLLAMLWVWLLPNSTRFILLKSSSRKMAVVQAVVAIYFFCLAIDQFGSYSPFLYFQF